MFREWLDVWDILPGRILGGKKDRFLRTPRWFAIVEFFLVHADAAFLSWHTAKVKVVKFKAALTIEKNSSLYQLVSRHVVREGKQKKKKKEKKERGKKKISTVPSSGSHSSVLKRDSMSISGHTSHTWSMIPIRADGCSQLFHARIERGTLFRLKDNALFPPPHHEQCTHAKIE